MIYIKNYRKKRIAGKNIKYSRFVMEQYLGRKLSIFECIHHKDKNPLNDDISNLQVMSREEHNSLHHAGSKKPRKKKHNILYTQAFKKFLKNHQKS
jgi:hypothetical protein